MVTKSSESQQIVISAPNMQRARFTIQGTAPLMTARFSKKAEIMRKQAEGARPGKKPRNARDFDSEWLDAAYQDSAGGLASTRRHFAMHLSPPAGWSGSR